MPLGTFYGSLHNHTDYSNLRLRDSTNRIESLINYAIELGHKCIAFTEHDTVSNAIKIENYYNKIKKEHPDFKVIRGNEIYLVPNGTNKDTFNPKEDKFWHFILLAKDAIGHKQIRELSTRAWKRGFEYRRMMRVITYYQDLEEIIGSNPGHVVGSTACLGGFLPSQLLKLQEHPEDMELRNNIMQWLRYMQNIFGKDNFYLEMQPSNNAEQIYVNKNLLQLSQIFNIPYIITTDSHYLKETDAPIHEAYLKAQDGDREVASFYKITYMMDTNELVSFFQYFDENTLNIAFQNIKTIADSCEDYTLKKPLKIPELLWRENIKNYSYELPYWYEKMPTLKLFSNSPYKSDKYLVHAIIDGIKHHVDLQNDAAYMALEDNLQRTWESSEVNNARWSAYYLNLQRNIDECWNAGTLVGPARGSGGGFILLYCLDIIQMNKLREELPLYPWRFLNPARVSVLDIDTDIEGGRRAQVLKHFRNVYGEDRVANVVTFGTEGSKSAILTAARGLGIDVDIAQGISALIPSDRGIVRTLKQCYYGDKENDFKPIAPFVAEMEQYPELWNVAQSIEGLICRMGIHAGGVIFVDEPFTESTALLRAPDGTICTQFDLHDDEAVSLIKIDLLSVEALDKIHTCLDLLCDNGFLKRKSTLKETYENAIGIYKLERNDPKMWDMVYQHKINSLFQMEQQSGIQGISLVHPTSVTDLAVLNSVIRLMPSDKEAERPLEKFAKFKANIDLWYQEMAEWGLTQNEMKILEPIAKPSYGVTESQESFMRLVQMPECGGFDLTWADRLRKSIAKKNPAEYEQLTKEYYTNIEEKHLSYNLCNYVWKVLIAYSRGYGFNAAHTLGYSLVALQEMNLAYNFPIIFWNCACLITDSGGEEGGTDYSKIATAINKMQTAGIKICPPDINKSQWNFVPDVENNQIFCGFKSLLHVGNEIIDTIIENRPYSSVKDFYYRVKPTRTVMVSLIKSGAFDTLKDRKEVMIWYLWETCDKKSRLTLQNLNGLFNYGLLPHDTEQTEKSFKVFAFNKHLKTSCKKGDYYKLDEAEINFLIYLNEEQLILPKFIMAIKEWEKVYKNYMQIFKNWIANDKENILNEFNGRIFIHDWQKYAYGTLSTWEMEILCFYYHEHELAHINKELYGLNDFFALPEEPEVEKTFRRGGKTIPIYKLTHIYGTCIAKNKAKSTISLLMPKGVVTVKFNKEYFAMYDKQISERQTDGHKKILEGSWFNRGNMLVVTGMRRGDTFLAKRYSSTPGHTLYHIDAIEDNGEALLRHDRLQGEYEESEEI